MIGINSKDYTKNAHHSPGGYFSIAASFNEPTEFGFPGKIVITG